MPRKKFNIIRFLSGFALLFFSLTILLGVGVVAITQTPEFRAWAVEKALKEINAGLQGKVELGEVSGDVLTGLRITNVRVLSADGSTVVSIPSLDARYQLIPLLKTFLTQPKTKRIAVDLVLNDPTINLVRDAHDGLWNFQRIAKPPAVTDTVSKPFDMQIEVSSLELRHAIFIMDDKTVAPSTSLNTVDYSHLKVNDLNLVATGYLDSLNKKLNIYSLSFTEQQSGVHVRHFAGEFLLESSGISIENMFLQTDHSNISLNARIDSLNIFGSQPMNDWRSYPLILSLNAPRVSTDELKRLLPSVAFLGGDPSLKLEASGKYGDILVRTLEVGFPDSRLLISGHVKNLNDPEQLYLDMKVAPSRLKYSSVPTYIPGIPLPDLSYLGTVDLESATFVGGVKEFTATFNAKTAVGAANGGVKIDMRSPQMKYVGDVAIVHGNLQPILKDERFHSDFTGRAVVNGTGTTLKDLTAWIRLESEGSMIAGRRYRTLYLDGSVTKGGILSADTLMISWGDTPAPKSIEDGKTGPRAPLPGFAQRDLQYVLEQRLGLTNEFRRSFAYGKLLALSGSFDLRNMNMPVFKVKMTGRDFNIADATLDLKQASRLTFTTEVNGRGIQLDSLETNGYLNLEFAELPDEANKSGIPKRLPPFALVFNLERLNKYERSLSIESEIADLFINGKWRFSTILPGIMSGLQSVVDYIGTKSRFETEATSISQRQLIAEPVDATYELNIRDVAPLALFWRGASLKALGELRGSIRSTAQSVDFSTSGKIGLLDYRADSMHLHMNDLYIDKFDLRGITPGNVEELAVADMKVRSDSSIQFNTLSFGSPSLAATLQNGSLKLRGSTSINNEAAVAVDGRVDIRTNSGYVARLDTLIIALPNDLQWHNVKPAVIAIGKDYVRADSLSLQRGKGEIISLTGAMEQRGGTQVLRNVKVDVTALTINELRNLVRPYADVEALNSVNGHLQQLGFRVSGTLQQPKITALIGIDSLNYAGSSVGNIRSQFDYNDRNLTGDIRVMDLRPQPKDSTFRVTAAIRIDSLPVDLAFAPREQRVIKGRNVRIEAASKDLPIAFLQPFIPGTRIKSGTVDLDFRVDGAFPDLHYYGSAKARKMKALVEGNNMLYYSDISLRFKDRILSIENGVIRNDPADFVQGKAEINGTITFDGFNISGIDITMRTKQFKVMSEATKAVNEVVYGDLIVATGDRPFRFHGSLNRPQLEGDVEVLRGSLTFPEYRPTTRITRRAMFGDLDEWLKHLDEEYGPVMDDDSSAGKAPTDSTAPAKKGSLDAAARNTQKKTQKKFLDQEPVAPPFADRILYDIGINVSGQLFVTMNFSIVEQLRAELGNEGGKLYFRRDDDGINRLLGKLVIKGDSKYFFLHTFGATGFIEFVNDLDNPNINIDARYSNNQVNTNGSLTPYTVDIKVRGTKKIPLLTMSYTFDGKSPSSDDPDENNRNALTLLLVGKLFNDLGDAGSGSTNVLTGTASETASSVAGQVLTKLLSGTGVISDVGVDISRARVNLVSVLGPVILRYGGQISSPADSKITISVPLSVISNINILRDFVVDIERESQNTVASGQTEDYRIGIQIRKSW